MLKKTIRCFCLLALCGVIMIGKTPFAAAGPTATNPLKVAYIYNIAKFTRWPEKTWASPDAPFLLCSYGKSDFDEGLKALEQKEVNGHPIRLLKPEGEIDFKQCNALFIDTQDRRRYRYLLSLIDPQTVLTISDDTSFFEYGGLVNLVEKDQRLRFEVNMQLLSRSRLKFSSKLLKLAILVDNTREY